MRTWFLLLVAVSVLVQATVNGARVLLSYRVLDFGGDAAVIGVFTAAFSMAPLVVALPAGRFADEGRAPAVMRTGLVALAIGALAMAASDGLWLLFGGYVVMGLAHMLTLIAAQGMVSSLHGSTSGLDSLFAYFTLGISVGQLVGIVFSGWIAARAGQTGPALWSLVAVAVVTVLIGWAHAGRYARLVDAQGDGPQSTTHENPLAIVGRKGMPAAMFASISVIVAIDLLTAYMPVAGEELGLSIGEVTAILAARSGAAIVSRAVMPSLLRACRRDYVLIVSLVAGVVPLLAMPWLPGVVWMFAATAVCGFAWGLVMPMTMTWVAQLAPSADRAMALSVRLMGNRLAQVILPPAAGVLATGAGALSVFIGSGVLLGVAAAGSVHARATGTMPT